MKVHGRARIVLQACLGLCLIGLATESRAADRAKKPMLETAVVPVDGNARKRLKAIQDYLSDKRWNEAVDLLQDISESEGRMLVLTQEGTSGEIKGYLSVATQCNVMLAKLPEEGLAAYRKKVDSQARRWYDHWKQTGDVRELHRIVRQAYLSSVGDEALWALGEGAWDQGDFATARLYWTQLVPLDKKARSASSPTILRYPDSELDPGAVLARLVLCTLMEAGPDRAEVERKRLAELYPFAEGTLAGRSGLFTDILKQIIGESSLWDLKTGVREASTFGLTAKREGIMPTVVDLGASRWSKSLTQKRLPQAERHQSNLDRGPLSYHPVVYQDIVFVNDAEKIWAWNVLTGEPAWPNEQGTAEIYLPDAESSTREPTQFCVGVPYYTMTISDGRLYARMGSPVTNQGEPGLLINDLVCLDIASGQGKLVWKIAATDLLKEELSPWSFEGSPLAVSGRIYVVLSRRRPQLEFCIACLEATTGALLWNRQVVSARTAVDENHNRISHLLLTAGAGKLFLSTDAGAIVAVNADDGRLEWAITYESQPAPHLTSLSDHLRQGLLPALFHDGWLFAAPNDCNRLFCIEADSGQIRWFRKQVDTNRFRHLLGVVPGGESGRLIVSGDSLWSFDIAGNGKLVFGPKSTLLGMPLPSEIGYGRGVLAGNVIYWPTREAIKIVDAATGRTVESKQLTMQPTPESGGNLTLAQEMLLVSQHDRIVAYCEYSLLKQRLERDLSIRMNPDEPNVLPATQSSKPGARKLATWEILGQLSDIEVATGNLDTAVENLRTAVQLMEASSGESNRTRYRARLTELLRQSAREWVTSGNVDRAWERIDEARQWATDATDIAMVQMDMGNVELARKRPVAAVEHWQAVLDDERLRDASLRTSSAGDAASSAISKLITERGRAVYTEVERRADKELASLLETKDLQPDTLRQALRQYPNSEAAARAWKHLALRERQEGRLHSSLAILARILQESDTTNEQAAAVADWADTLELAGYWRPAQEAWRKLASRKLASESISFGGATERADDLARRRLSRAEYQLPSEESTVSFLDPVWSVPLAGRQAAIGDAPRYEHVLFPEQQPPADALACVLARQSQIPGQSVGEAWTCLDRKTGTPRWKWSVRAPIEWAAYGETHLLLATNTFLYAVTLEDGRELWARPIIAPSESDSTSGTGDVAARKSAADAKPQFQWAIRGDLAFCFDPRMGLSAIQTCTGQHLWSFQPARGKMQRAWACGTRQIALQTLHPSVTWLVDVAPERRVTEIPGSSDPWLQGPVLIDDSAILMTEDRKIECRSVETGRRTWRYQGGMSFAHVNPVLWSPRGDLLLTIDGTTLANIDITSGRTEWTTGVADYPLNNPASQIVATDGMAFVANLGLLRRISLKNGACQWERYLGSSATQWGVQNCQTTVVAWPVPSRTLSGQMESIQPHVVWLDARSGRIIQRWNAPSDSRIISVHGKSQECLVQTDQALIAFRVRQEGPGFLSALNK